MDHKDHVTLIEKGIARQSGGVWADIGSGTGAFTLALRDIAGEDVEIFSIDQDRQRLADQKETFDHLFPGTTIHFVAKNFMDDLELPGLDGILAANSIHFEKDTLAVLKHLKQYLKPQGKLLVVEYNIDHGNMWVPYPFSYPRFERLAAEAGFRDTRLLSTISSLFLKEIYAAEARIKLQ